jgi:hypothetical protein
MLAHPDPFSELRDTIAVMSNFPRPWLVAGGWALDLYLERVTRPHKDVDLAIFREDQLELQRHFAGWRLDKAHSGTLTAWPEGEYLQLPLMEIWAWRPGTERGDNQPDLEILLDQRVAGEWRFRKQISIARPLSLACLLTESGIPYIAPEIALLYKSSHRRDEDEADFEVVRGALDEERKGWLKRALETYAPGHTWLGRL